MNDDRFQRLSEYLDDGLSPADRAAVERDLESDEELRTVLAELRAVKRAAAEVVDRAPGTDLWPGIAERIESDRVLEMAPARRTRRTFTFTVPQFAAAMIATLVVGSAAVWLTSSLAEQVSPDAVTTAPVADAGATDVQLASAGPASGPAQKGSDLAIADLERRLAEDRASLDSSTVRIIEESLETIDRAIRNAAVALEADPGNMWLNRHLADSKTRKLRLLEKAAALAAVRT